MISSRWQLNRIGMTDFWYYDEQEFYLLDGRMLLRGANGSGKSVTMQSFIPVLLDGNIRPERLDPFGSRARKMENYLLEEGDDRNERTGYLYMEFQRLDGNNYLTIGMGMRARRNKKLETWYFFINDGRRVGKDFFLYKDVGSKITFTKQELKNRIGEGGRVIESQNEYMEWVNRLLFGFDTIDQYKEMLELLLQLRSPKLSKEFRPTVINEILSNALQTLSEDDLRPMSEAIENMDAIKANMNALKESVQGAKQIERVYNQYNCSVLFDKADGYLKELKQWRISEQKAKEIDAQISVCEKGYAEQNDIYTRLQQEEQILKEEKHSLDTSDAVRLKEQEMELQKEQIELQSQKRKKDNQKDDKEIKRIQEVDALRHCETEQEMIWQKIAVQLEEMDELLTDLTFDEFAFMSQELQKNPMESYDFRMHLQLCQDYRQKIQDGIKILQEVKLYQEKYDDQLLQVDNLRKERDERERTCKQHEVQLQEIKSECIEKVYVWNGNNQAFKLASDDLQQISRMVENFYEGSDYADIRAVARKSFDQQREIVNSDLQEEQMKLKVAKQSLKDKEEELNLWLQKEDPEPERPEEVRKNRALLQEMGIPFWSFYQVVDFAEQLQPDQASRLEEALMHMGVLDALIIPSDYREQVLALNEGTNDRYIFTDATEVQNNLMEMLQIDNPEQDLIFYQQISNVLGSIGCNYVQADTGTWITEEGQYQLGIIEGTISGTYQSKFIGAQARARYLQQEIERLQQEHEEYFQAFQLIQSNVDAFKQKMTQMEAEEKEFPDGVDLRTAASDYQRVVKKLDDTTEQLEQSQKKLDPMYKQLTGIKLRTQEVCKRIYLSANLEVFEAANSCIDDYQNELIQLQGYHYSYLNMSEKIRSSQDSLEQLELDLAEIIDEQFAIEKKLQKVELSLVSVKNQMEMTDYEEIREHLDYCIKRLTDIPREREEAVDKRASLQAKKTQLSNERIINEEMRIHLSKRVAYLQSGFSDEYALGYVEHDFYEMENKEELANHVYQMLASTYKTKKQTDYFTNIQEVYHQYRGYLLEYQLTLENIFDNTQENPSDEVPEYMKSLPSMRRVDITGKYRGVTVKFKELIEKLQADIDDKMNLLSSKDRELFEDILANTISKKIRARIHESKNWVTKMNDLMGQMKTSSGLKLSLKWKNKQAEHEEQLDTKALVALLQKDVEIMREEESEALSKHFRSKIDQARKLSDAGDHMLSFHAIIKEVLDYRKWFEFQLAYQKTGESQKELTDRAFYTFSGGEKAMCMYVPLFSAVVAKYKGANQEAPRLISLDEAFAGVDRTNIQDMFRLMVECEFNFIINSQILWGDYETVPAISIYQLLRPENAKYVTVISYVWNGKERYHVNQITDETNIKSSLEQEVGEEQ